MTKLLLVAFGLLFTLNCSNNSGGDDIAGTATEVKNSAVISGRVTNNDGMPAANVMVRFVSKDHDPGAGSTVSLEAKDSCLTDANGYYYTNALTSGTWNILAANSNNSGKVYVDSVVFTGDTLKVSDAALTVPGAVRGSVKVQRGDDPKIVSVYVIGALAYSMVEGDGGFGFGSMAKGRYKLRFRAFDPKYEVLDTVVDIASGVNKSIDSPIVLPLRIPTPTGLRLSYNTLKQSVTLQWDAMNPKKVAGYNIYRQQVDSAEKKLNPVVFKAGTTFIDSTAIQDLRYIYRVASVDSIGNEGSFKAVWKDTVTIEPAFKLVSTFGGPGTGDGKFSSIKDVKYLKDGRIAVVDFGSNKFQVFDSSGTFIFSRGSYGDGSGQFNSPIAITEDSSGNLYILEFLGNGRIQKFNSAGTYEKTWSVGAYCTDITYDGNNIFVVDPLNKCIKHLNLVTDTITIAPFQDGHTYDKVSYSLFSRKLIAVEDHEDKIIIMDTNCTVLNQMGCIGTSNGQFNNIFTISTTKSGLMIITDRDNYRVQLLREPGEFITKLYTNSSSGLRPTCSDISTDNRHIYISTGTSIFTYFASSNVNK
ncbi:MAG: hypothetical protein JNL74_02130 [Fibrobacteres bacterium]|nr:hypothetical protein [Fibrobacterota bacterium]